jgi:hypothetical protein
VVARLYTTPAHEQRPRRLKLRNVGQRTLPVLPSLDGVANGATLHRDADQVVRRYAAVLFAYLLTGTEPDEDTTAGRTAWVKGMQSLAATMVGGETSHTGGDSGCAGVGGSAKPPDGRFPTRHCTNNRDDGRFLLEGGASLTPRREADQ